MTAALPSFNIKHIALLFIGLLCVFTAHSVHAAAPSFSFTVNMSEAVTVTGTPQIALNVGGLSRTADYASGTGTSALTFTYTATPGDLDLNGIGISSPISLNGGTIEDLAGNAIDAADLAFTPPDTSNVNISYPSMSMDFANDRYSYNGTLYNSFSTFASAASVTFTNDGNGTYVDASGNIQQGSANTPRLDHDPDTLEPLGILIEEERTNLFTYNKLNDAALQSTDQMLGDVSINGSQAGVTAEVVATGTENGLPYIDWHIYGTNSSGGVYFFNITDTNTVNISAGYNLTVSAYLKLVAGSTSGTTIRLYQHYRDGSNALLSSTTLDVTPSITSNLTRFFNPSTAPTSSATLQHKGIYVRMANGATADITLRVAGLQVEEGEFATSYIPTSGSAVTRAADSLTIPTSGGWYNQSAGTVFTDQSYVSETGSGFPMFWRFDDGTGGNRWNTFFSQSTNDIRFNAFNGGSGQGAFIGSSGVSGSIVMAVGQAENNTNVAFNGTLDTTKTAWAVPTVTQLRLDQVNTSISKWTKEFRYYPLRVEDAQLQLLSTP